MYYVYILQSQKSGRFYIGYSQDPIRRLADHNSGKVISTRNLRPWVKVYSEVFQSEAEAIRRESEIKKMKSRHYIEQLIQKEKSGGIGQTRPDHNPIIIGMASNGCVGYSFPPGVLKRDGDISFLFLSRSSSTSSIP